MAKKNEDSPDVPEWAFWVLYALIAVPAGAALVLVLFILLGGDRSAGALESAAILLLALVVPLALPWLRHRHDEHRRNSATGGSVL
jgi:hypothetical protein